MSSRLPSSREERVALARRAASHEAEGWSAGELNELGVAMLNEAVGESDVAVALFSQALARAPRARECFVNLGVALVRRGDVAFAVAAFRVAVGLDTRDAVAFANLGLALQMMGEPQAAAVALQESIRLRPDYAEAASNAAIVLHDVGKRDDALHCARHAVAALCFAKKNKATAPEEQRRGAEAARYNYARVCLDAGATDEALAIFVDLRSDARVGVSTRAECLNNIAIVYAMRGDALACDQALDDALALVPGSATYARNAGAVSVAHRRLGRAIEMLRRSADIDASNADTFSNLGVAYVESDDLNNAIIAFTHALRLAPNDPRFAFNLGCALLRYALDDWPQDLARAKARAAEAKTLLAHAATAQLANAKYAAVLDTANAVLTALDAVSDPALFAATAAQHVVLHAPPPPPPASTSADASRGGGGGGIMPSWYHSLVDPPPDHLLGAVASAPAPPVRPPDAASTTHDHPHAATLARDFGTADFGVAAGMHGGMLASDFAALDVDLHRHHHHHHQRGGPGAGPPTFGTGAPLAEPPYAGPDDNNQLGLGLLADITGRGLEL